MKLTILYLSTIVVEYCKNVNDYKKQNFSFCINYLTKLFLHRFIFPEKDNIHNIHENS